MCTVFIYYVYMNIHTYSMYFENIYMYLHVYNYVHIIYYKYIYLIFKTNIFFGNIYMQVCVCVYLYKHNK